MWGLKGLSRSLAPSASTKKIAGVRTPSRHLKQTMGALARSATVACVLHPSNTLCTAEYTTWRTSGRRQRVAFGPAHVRSLTPCLPPPAQHDHEQRPRTSSWTPSRYAAMRQPLSRPGTRRAAVGPSTFSRFASGPDAQDRRIARTTSFVASLCRHPGRPTLSSSIPPLRSLPPPLLLPLPSPTQHGAFVAPSLALPRSPCRCVAFILPRHPLSPLSSSAGASPPRCTSSGPSRHPQAPRTRSSPPCLTCLGICRDQGALGTSFLRFFLLWHAIHAFPPLSVALHVSQPRFSCSRAVLHPLLPRLLVPGPLPRVRYPHSVRSPFVLLPTVVMISSRAARVSLPYIFCQLWVLTFASGFTAFVSCYRPPSPDSLDHRLAGMCERAVSYRW